MMNPQEVSSRLHAQEPRPANLQGLIDLYRDDPELFYALALVGTDPDSELGRLAAKLRKIIQHGYDLADDSVTGARVVRGGQESIPLAGADELTVSRFLGELNGSAGNGKPGKDYAGVEVSEAEVAFKLGTHHERQLEADRLRDRDAEKPLVLRLDDHDRHEVVSGMPGYVVYGLQYLAPKLVQSAAVMYRGLRREGRLKDGFAFCGRLRHAYDNQGEKVPAPAGKVFVVYANRDGYVFDWDWVEEDPHHAGYPIDTEARFTGDPEPAVPDAALTGVDDLEPTLQFDPRRAWCSPQGDCVFCYFSDEMAYADRIDNDLTVFRSFGTGEPTGFKIKNVNRMVKEGLVELDAPDLGVAVHSFLLASFQRNPQGIKVYRLLIGAWFKTVANADLPTVALPQGEELCHAGA